MTELPVILQRLQLGGKQHSIKDKMIALFFFSHLDLSLLPLQVDRLMELYFKYLDAMQAADKKIDGEKHVCIA